jgi:hypothetical protein
MQACCSFPRSSSYAVVLTLVDNNGTTSQGYNLSEGSSVGRRVLEAFGVKRCAVVVHLNCLVVAGLNVKHKSESTAMTAAFTSRGSRLQSSLQRSPP